MSKSQTIRENVKSIVEAAITDIDCYSYEPIFTSTEDVQNAGVIDDNGEIRFAYVHIPTQEDAFISVQRGGRTKRTFSVQINILMSLKLDGSDHNQIDDDMEDIFEYINGHVWPDLWPESIKPLKRESEPGFVYNLSIIEMPNIGFCRRGLITFSVSLSYTRAIS